MRIKRARFSKRAVWHVPSGEAIVQGGCLADRSAMRPSDKCKETESDERSKEKRQREELLLVARSYLVLVVQTVVILLQPMWRRCSHMKYRPQPLSIVPGFVTPSGIGVMTKRMGVGDDVWQHSVAF